MNRGELTANEKTFLEYCRMLQRMPADEYEAHKAAARIRGPQVADFLDRLFSDTDRARRAQRRS